MSTFDPINDGEVLYRSRAKPIEPWVTMGVGLILALLFAVPAASSLIKCINQSWSIGLLLMSLAFASLSIVSAICCVRLASRKRRHGVTLRDDKLIFDIDSSRDSVQCSDIIGAKKELDGVSVWTNGGRSIYLPEQFIGSEQDMSEFVNCVESVIRSRKSIRKASAVPAYHL